MIEPPPQIVSPGSAGFTFDNQIISYITNNIIGIGKSDSKRNRRFYMFIHSTFVIFMTVVVAVASILAFIAASLDLDDESNRDTVKGISIAIGVLGIVTEAIQGLATGFEIESRKKFFRQSEIDYGRLEDKIKTQYMITTSSHGSPRGGVPRSVIVVPPQQTAIEKLRARAIKSVGNITRRTGFSPFKL